MDENTPNTTANIAIPVDLKEAAQALGRPYGLSLSAVVRLALSEYLRKHDKPEPARRMRQPDKQ